MTNYYYGSDSVVAGVARALALNDNIYVGEGVDVGTTGAATDAVTMAGSNTATIYGNVFSMGNSAISSSAGDNVIRVGVGGSVSGDQEAIDLTGDGNNIVNDGHINGERGIDIAFGDFTYIANTGTISARYESIHITGGTASIVNSGTISSVGFVIRFDTLSSVGISQIANSGTIQATSGIPNTGILGGDSVLWINNSGHIGGGISFGLSDDRYDGTLGTIDGRVDGDRGDDLILCGNGRDDLLGGEGSDTLDGGGARDTFTYINVDESGGPEHDTILGFDARKDQFAVFKDVNGIDSTVNGGQLRDANFVADLTAAVGAAELQAHHAVLFKPTSGDYDGHTLLIIGQNKFDGFQADKDFVMDLVDFDNLGALSVDSFI